MRLNRPHYDDLARWCFTPGMGFGEKAQWWAGREDLRPVPHEGVDFVLYEDAKGLTRSIFSHTLIPAMYRGEVVGQFRDFLGETLAIGHASTDGRGKRLCSLYGHLEKQGVGRVGSAVEEGEAIGAVAPALSAGQVTPHLHLSLAWILLDAINSTMCWNSLIMNQQTVWLDPLVFMVG